MSILNVNKIQPVGSGQTVTISAANISAGSATITAASFSGNLTGSVNLASGITTVAAGSASAPSITPTGDSNTGIFFPAADTIAFAEGGVEAARIDSSGQLGIGTIAPSSFVHLLQSSGNAKITIQRSNTASNTDDYGSILWRSSAANNNGAIGVARESAENNGYMYFSTGTGGTLSERLRIKSDGKTGINNTNPLSTLSVGSRTGDVSDTSSIFTAGGSSSGGEVLAATFCNTASGASNNATAISFTCRAGDSQTAKIVAKQPSGASSPNTQLDFYVYNNSGSTRVATFDQNGVITTPYQPALLMYATSGSNQTVSNNVGTKVQIFNTSSFSRGLTWDTTNHRVTVPVAGYYQVHAKINNSPDGASGNDDFLAVFKNGVNSIKDNAYRQPRPVAQWYQTYFVSVIVSCNANDYLEIYYYQNSGGSRAVHGDMGYVYVYLIG